MIFEPGFPFSATGLSGGGTERGGEPGEHGGESIQAIIPELTKHRFFGLTQRFRLVITDRRLIFQRRGEQWRLRPRRHRDLSDEAVKALRPDEVLGLTLGSYSLSRSEVTAVRVREVIPFTLVLDPKDAANVSSFTGEDDIVHEVPNVIRRDRGRHVDEVERQWVVTFESPSAVLTYTASRDPRQVLRETLADKLR
ncbi:hypothetical protein JXL21_01540 [Candidatus Bathyarchaeota archaeon]|nr:hypothetical protein [Candidatus Bathyarchaeota archaeon]